MKIQVQENTSPIINFVEEMFVERFEESFLINEYGQVEIYEGDIEEEFLAQLLDELAYLMEKLDPEQLAVLTPSITKLVEAITHSYGKVEN